MQAEVGGRGAARGAGSGCSVSWTVEEEVLECGGGGCGKS